MADSNISTKPAPCIGLVCLNLDYAVDALDAALEMMHSADTGDAKALGPALGIVASVREMVRSAGLMKPFAPPDLATHDKAPGLTAGRFHFWT